MTFHPNSGANNANTDVHLLYDLDGGMIIGIDSKVILKSQISRYSRLMQTYINGVIITVRPRKNDYSMFLSAIMQSRTDLLRTLNQTETELSAAKPNFKELDNILKLLRKQALFLRDVIKSMQDQIETSNLMSSFKTAMIMRLKFLSRATNQLWSLAAIPTSMQVQESFSGFQIKYLGMICFYSFCIRDVNVLIDSSDDNNSTVLINSTLNTNQRLGGLITLKSGSVLSAAVSKESGKFDIFIPIVTKVLGKEYKSGLRVNSTHFIVDLGNAALAKETSFGVQLVASNSESTKWQDVFFTLLGKETKLSKLSQAIESDAKVYVIRTAKSGALRLKRAHLRLSITKQQFDIERNITGAKYQRLLAATRNVKDAEIIYLRASVRHNSTLKRYRAQRQAGNLSDLEKKLNKRCLFQKCQKLCVSVPLWKVCQKPITVELESMKCQQDPKQQKVSVVETYETHCQRTIYYTEEIYTGNCGRPSRRIRLDPIEKAVVNFGIAGALAGSIFGPVGALMGGIIGGIVGFFTGFFGGCDDTWEAIIRYKNIQVPCIQSRHTTITKKWTETDCYPTKISAISGYSLPEPCNVSDSCQKVENPYCLLYNSKCRINRTIELQKQLGIANVSSSIFQDLQNAEQVMKQRHIALQRVRVKLQNEQQNYDISSSNTRSAKLQFDLANINFKNLHKIISLERCVMDASLSLNDNVSSVLRVTEIVFRTNRVNERNPVLDIGSISTVDSKKINGYLFQFEFDNLEFSTRKAAQGLVKNLFCKSLSRRRRSVGGLQYSSSIGTTQLDSSPSIIDGIQNLTASQKACIQSTVALNVLRESIDRLTNISNSVLQRNVLYQNAQQSFLNVRKKMNWTTTNDTVLAEQENLLTELKKGIISRKLSLNDTWKQWLQDMEVVTVTKNFTGCSGFEDCLEQTFLMLEDLPDLLRTPRQVFSTALNKVKNGFMLALSGQRSNRSVQQVIDVMTSSLNELLNLTLFCERAPNVKLSPSFQVKVLAGSSLKLHCIATSKLKLYYRWIKDNNTLVGNENPTLVIDNVEKSSEGRYLCEAWTLAGKSTSEECYVVVAKPPRILQDPENYAYRTSMPSELMPSFLCKISSDPTAKISWSFHPYENPLRVVNLAENASVLHVDNPTKAKGGHYACFGENEVGNVTSEKARLDILSTITAGQGASLEFLAINNTIEMLSNDSYFTAIASNRDFLGQISTNVSNWKDGSNKTKVAIRLIDSNDKRDMDKLTEIQMVKRISRTRKAFAGIFNDIIVNLAQHINNTEQSNLLKETIKVYSEDSTCPEGMELHSNGATCGKSKYAFLTYLYHVNRKIYVISRHGSCTSWL